MTQPTKLQQTTAAAYRLGLGIPVMSVNISPYRWRTTLLEGIGLILAGLLGFSLVLAGQVAWAIVLPLCLATGAVGIYRLVVHQREKERVIILFESGLAFQRHDRTSFMRWDDVQAVFGSILVNRNVNESHYTLVLSSAEQTMKIKASNRDMTGIEFLHSRAQEEVSRRLLPRAVSAFEAGRTLEFGPFRLNHAGLQAAKKQLPWAEVQDLTVKKGIVYIRARNKRSAWTQASAEVVPNLLVFSTLVDQILHSDGY